jgi:hypothetical protein
MIARGAAPGGAPVQRVLDEYCADCHNPDKKKGDLNLKKVATDDFTQHFAEWEKVIRRVRARQMAPPGKDRPDERTYVPGQD